jgi:sporulation protein YlmC with PRC-barrel domain
VEVRVHLGAHVRCSDTRLGTVADVVIEPASRRLTHVVVDTADAQARLVPVELVGPGDGKGNEVSLTCSKEELLALEPIRRFAYLQFDDVPAAEANADVGVEDAVVIPSYGAAELGATEIDPAVGITYDQIPHGQAELRDTSPVVTADGHDAGHVDGFLLSDGRLTHVIVERSSLWSASALTVPIDDVAAIATDSVTLRLSRDALAGLPAVKTRRFLFF